VKSRSQLSVAAGALCLVAAVAPCDAEGVRFVVEQTRPFVESTTFGDVGAYERLDGTAYMEVDPRDLRNNFIVDLDRAAARPGEASRRRLRTGSRSA
jgi:hypothetical protein